MYSPQLRTHTHVIIAHKLKCNSPSQIKTLTTKKTLAIILQQLSHTLINTMIILFCFRNTRAASRCSYAFYLIEKTVTVAYSNLSWSFLQSLLSLTHSYTFLCAPVHLSMVNYFMKTGPTSGVLVLFCCCFFHQTTELNENHQGKQRINSFPTQGTKGHSCQRKEKVREGGRSRKQETSRTWLAASSGSRTLGRQGHLVLKGNAPWSDCHSVYFSHFHASFPMNLV